MVKSVQNQVFTNVELKKHIAKYLPQGKDRVAFGMINRVIAFDPQLRPSVVDIGHMRVASTPLDLKNKMQAYQSLIPAIRRARRVDDAFTLINDPHLDLNQRIHIRGDEIYARDFLDEDARRTVGTLALVLLFDPTNGWSRDYHTRPEMLKLASLLVERGAKLEGIKFFRKSLVQEIEGLARWNEHPRHDGGEPIITEEIVARFQKAGYDLDLPINS